MSGKIPAIDSDDARDRYSLEQLKNIGHCVTGAAIRWPETTAVAAPILGLGDSFQRRFRRRIDHRSNTRFKQITYSELEVRSNQIANGLIERGLTPGTRIALMVPPGIDFVAWVFGLFKAQAVVVLIDPGMGRKNMIRCLADVKPEGIVGIPLAQLMRTLFLRRIRECRFNVVLGTWPGCFQARSFCSSKTTFSHDSNQSREQPAAIIFTTGSTGVPKGVLYRHRTFIEQARQIRDYFDIKPGTVDVSGFPLFALFNIGMGATTVFPKMDSTRPASVHPPEIIHAVETFQADQSFGSPALWNTVSKYCIEHDVRLPTLKRVLSAGAPVPPRLLAQIKQLISPDGEAFTPYGATESLPVACISASQVLNETAKLSRNGAGTCVGARFPDLNWKVIRISDAPIADVSHCEFLGPGEIGELIVQGAVVSDQYVTRIEANAAHKINDGDSFWHRMGDVGYLDLHDRFWFCGRKSHRVLTIQETLFTIPCEAIYNNHPKIYRSALVGIRPDSDDSGYQTPVIIVEPFAEHWPHSEADRKQLLGELKELGLQHEKTSSISHVLLHQSLPVDIRHNSKIFREQLRPWATARILG